MMMSLCRYAVNPLPPGRCGCSLDGASAIQMTSATSMPVLKRGTVAIVSGTRPKIPGS